MFQGRIALSIIPIFVIPLTAFPQPGAYPGLRNYDSSQCIANRVAVPEGCERTEAIPGSFGDWLRRLPLKNGRPPVFLFDKREKTNQRAHFAVMDMDVGTRDLQQCADAVIRLRAEYLYSQKQFGKIRFNFTSGDAAYFRNWIDGFRPIVRGNSVRWNRTARRDSSYANFRQYLNSVFTYAGSYSLSRECQAIRNHEDLAIGDIFIEAGFPGHAVIIVDMAVNRNTGKKLMLLAQSYMPAQDIHVLVNENNPDISPWYELDFGEQLRTPEWIFSNKAMMRLR